MKNFVVLIRERAWENEKWLDYFMIENTEYPEQNFRDAIKEYLMTPEGKQAIEQTSEDFNWGDSLIYVPEHTWNKYGIYSISDGDTVTLTQPVEILVDQDEVLIPNEYYDEEE